MAKKNEGMGIRTMALLLAVSIFALAVLLFLLNVELPGSEEKDVCMVIDTNSTYCSLGQIHVFIKNVCSDMKSAGTPQMHALDDSGDDLGTKACIYGKTDIVLLAGQSVACTNMLSGEVGNNTVWITPRSGYESVIVTCQKYPGASTD